MPIYDTIISAKFQDNDMSNMVSNKITVDRGPRAFFFLGAGASVPAGVPDTEAFVNRFIEHIKETGSENEEKTIAKILETLENKNPIDVEVLLDTLERLAKWETDSLSNFFVVNTQEFQNSTLKSLAKNLKRFIRKETIVGAEDIMYLEPLAHKCPLEIFTVNYDVCIEQFCHTYSLRYTDGFELYWHPEYFKGDYDVKLYKIHGSVTWYRTNKGTFVKIPIVPKDDDGINLVHEEKATNVMIYPIPTKKIDAKPLWWLLLHLSDVLARIELCIIVGYRFRDEEVRRIFFEASEINRDLKICIISPDAGDIFSKRLRFVDANQKIPSRLNERVICMNHKFEKILQYRCLNDLERSLTKLSGKYEKAQEVRREGSHPESYFVECAEISAEIGYIPFAERKMAPLSSTHEE